MVGTGTETLRKRARALRSKHCTELSYRITVPKDVFSVERFSNAIGPSVESNGWRSVVRGARNSKLTDYHLHIYWKQDGAKRKLQVDYHTWPPEPEQTHAEPYAEDFFDWVGQFFDVKSVNAHIHGEFEYTVEKWQSRIMALPLKVPYGDKTAEIEGLSIKLPVEPHGVHDLWVFRGKKTLDLQLYADRQLEFKNFTPDGDVDAFVSVAMSLIQERKA